MLREEYTIKCNIDIRKLNEYVITVCMTCIWYDKYHQFILKQITKLLIKNC